MIVTHHPGTALLRGHVAGTLPEAFDLAVAVHLTLCDACRADLAAEEALGGAVLDLLPPAAMAPDALTRTLARLDEPGDPVTVPARRNAAPGLPAPLGDYVVGGLDDIPWRPVGMGVRQARLRVRGAASARLLRIPAGAAVPDHGHRGTELTLVLRGAFRDDATRYGPGDMEVADQSVHHTPTAEAGVDCICLAATDAPLRFTDLLPRLAQPFLRI